MICLLNCVVARVIDKHHKHHKLIPRNRDTLYDLYGIIDSSNDTVESTTPHPKPKSQDRPVDKDEPVSCHFVNACQIEGVFRTCFHCNLKASNLDITDGRF